MLFINPTTCAMKLKTNLILLLTILSLTAFAQKDDYISQSIENAKKIASAKGYSLLDAGDVNSHSSLATAFDTEHFKSGYSYYVVAFAKNCASCEIVVQFWDYATETRNFLNPQIQRDGNYAMAEWVTYQKNDAYGRIDVYVNSATPHYLYAMLFWKWN